MTYKSIKRPKLYPHDPSNPYPLSQITIAKMIKMQENEQRSIAMENMTGCADAPKANRQSRNVPIDDNLQTLRNRLDELHDRLDSLKRSYSGEPSVPTAKGPDQPQCTARPMMLLVAELPGDLTNVSDQVSNAIEKVIQLQDMIL